MKIVDLLESSEWENTAYTNKQSEISHLEGKRKAIQPQITLLFHKFQQMIKAGLVVPVEKASPGWWEIPGTGNRDTDFIKYYAPPDQPQAKQFAKHLQKLKDLDHELQKRIADLTVRGHTFVFTGFRDTDMERKIEIQGGRTTSAVSNKTNYVVAANPNDHTGKVLKAKQLGVRVISKAQLTDFLRD